MRAKRYWVFINEYNARLAIKVVVVLAVMSNGASFAQQAPLSGTPDQLAADIARTMTATSPAQPANAPITQQVSAHGNIVESHTIFRDANAFDKAKANSHNVQAQLTRYMCKPERRTYIKKGVTFKYTTTGPSDAAGFAFAIDEAACGSLTKIIAADPALVARQADDIARQLTTLLSTQKPGNGSQFEKAIATNGKIQIVNKITSAAFEDFIKMKSYAIRGRTQGFLCFKFADAIRQGVQMNVAYTREDGSRVLEFPVDNSVC